MDSQNLFDEPMALEEDKLQKLQNLVTLYKNLEKEIENLEEAISQKKKAFEEVSRVKIPSLLNSAGLSEVRLSSGEKIIVEEKIKASIADKNYLVAYNNMIKSEGGDAYAKEVVDNLFKSKAIIEASDEILEKLIEQNVPYELKRDIHWQTLVKYCREKLENGKPIPEGISVFQYQETKIK
ncbi:MAG: hypothetical protein QXO70_02690 [Candidatus Pacearchaeota archaeon]